MLIEGISIAKSKLPFYYFPKPILIFHILQDEKPSVLPTKLALKQNIPLFKESSFGYKIWLQPGWFFLKEITSSPLRSMYPYPVSGFVGTIKSNNISSCFFYAS
jgi:hypothetical protein